MLASCYWTPESKYIQTGKEAVKKQNWPLAEEHFEKTVKVAPESTLALEAAQEGAKVSLVHTKDFNRLIFFLRHIILNSKSQDERVSAQRLLAETYYDKRADYPNAIIELNKLLSYIEDRKEQASIRLMLARAHFFQNDFFQARSEVDAAIEEQQEPDFLFKALLLKANIYFNEKKQAEAIALYEKLMRDYPEKSKEEQVALNLAICYEDKEEFSKAIEVLEKAIDEGYVKQEMLEVKVTTLKARQLQQPGAKGLRK